MTFNKFLICAFAILMMASCQKEESVAYTVPTMDDASYMSQLVSNPIIFQYTEHLKDLDKVRGWIITKSGDVRKFDLPSEDIDLEFNRVSRSYLDNLMNLASESIGKVDITELRNKYQQNLVIGRSEVSATAKVDEGVTIDKMYSSYILNTAYTSSSGEEGDCQGSFHDPHANSNYLSVLLKQSGESSFRNTSTNTNVVLNWLEAHNLTYRTVITGRD